MTRGKVVKNTIRKEQKMFSMNRTGKTLDESGKGTSPNKSANARKATPASGKRNSDSRSSGPKRKMQAKKKIEGSDKGTSAKSANVRKATPKSGKRSSDSRSSSPERKMPAKKRKTPAKKVQLKAKTPDSSESIGPDSLDVCLVVNGAKERVVHLDIQQVLNDSNQVMHDCLAVTQEAIVDQEEDYLIEKKQNQEGNVGELLKHFKMQGKIDNVPSTLTSNLHCKKFLKRALTRVKDGSILLECHFQVEKV